MAADTQAQFTGSGDVAVTGKFIGNWSSQTAVMPGSSIVSGTGGNISFSLTTTDVFGMIATPQAGNAVPFSVNNVTTGGFDWLNGGPAFSGSDRVTYWGIRI